MSEIDRKDILQLGNEKHSECHKNIPASEDQGLTQVVQMNLTPAKSHYSETVSNGIQYTLTSDKTNLVHKAQASPAASLMLPKNEEKPIPITTNEMVSSQSRYLVVFGSCCQLEGIHGRNQVKCTKTKPVGTDSTVSRSTTEDNASSSSIVETHAFPLLATSKLPDFPSVKHIPIASHEIVSPSYSLSSALETGSASQLQLNSVTSVVWTTLNKTRVATSLQPTINKSTTNFTFRDNDPSTSHGSFVPACLTPSSDGHLQMEGPSGRQSSFYLQTFKDEEAPSTSIGSFVPSSATSITKDRIISEHSCPPPLGTNSDTQLQKGGTTESLHLVAPCQSELVSTTSSRTRGRPTHSLTCDLSGQASTKSNRATEYIMKLNTQNVHEKKYECSLCGYRCRYLSVMKIHIRIHTGEKPYSCAKCTYTCTQRTHLLKHITTRCKFKPFECYLCPYKCSDPNDLRLHFNNKHNI